jgi:hypothetical protein
MRSIVVLVFALGIAGCPSFDESAPSNGTPDASSNDGGSGDIVDGTAPPPDAASDSGAPQNRCTGTERLFDPFADRVDVKGEWIDVFSDGSGSAVIADGVLTVSAAAVTDTTRPRRGLGYEWQNATRACVAFTLTITAPDAGAVYTGGGETLFTYLGAKWPDNHMTYAGIAFTSDGPKAYAEHTNGSYEFQTTLSLRRPNGVPVMIIADYAADSVEISVAETKHEFPSVRGATTGLPTLYVIVGVAQHGPAPAASAVYDDVHLTFD